MNLIRLMSVLIALLVSSQVLAYPSTIYGSWETDGPIEVSPRGNSYGYVTLEENFVGLEIVCDYRQGPLMNAYVESNVRHFRHGFDILHDAVNQTRQGAYTCAAHLGRGIVEYQYDARRERLLLFNRHTGWRLSLVRSR